MPKTVIDYINDTYDTLNANVRRNTTSISRSTNRILKDVRTNETETIYRNQDSTNISGVSITGIEPDVWTDVLITTHSNRTQNTLVHAVIDMEIAPSGLDGAEWRVHCTHRDTVSPTRYFSRHGDKIIPFLSIFHVPVGNYIYKLQLRHQESTNQTYPINLHSSVTSMQVLDI